ncbi:MAG: peroxiredoxin [Sandaracinaceae bacterium]|nr:peroxiredoxin [Sandaracinaceae bacterium]
MSLTIGKKPKAFKLEASGGGTISLADLAGKWTILYFYPRDNTPGCTTEAHNFRDAQAEIEALGAEVYGISRDSIASHEKFIEKHGLNFRLLSDPDAKMIEAYGAFGEKVLYGKRSMGIIRSTVILDPDNKVAAHFPKVRVKGHVDAVIEKLRELVEARG